MESESAQKPVADAKEARLPRYAGIGTQPKDVVLRYVERWKFDEITRRINEYDREKERAAGRDFLRECWVAGVAGVAPEAPAGYWSADFDRGFCGGPENSAVENYEYWVAENCEFMHHYKEKFCDEFKMDVSSVPNFSMVMAEAVKDVYTAEWKYRSGRTDVPLSLRPPK